MRQAFFLMFVTITLRLTAQDYFNNRLEFQYPWAFDGAGNCMEVEDGYIVNGVTGHALNPYWHQLGIAKIDYSGNELWKKTWGDTISRWFYADRNSLQKVNDSYYSFGTNTTYYESGSLYEITMIKYNLDFDTIFTKKISELIPPYDSAYIARSFAISESGFIIAGTISYQGAHSESLLLAVDTSGNVLWEQVYGTSDLFYTAKSVVVLENGDIVFGGQAYRIGNYGAVLGDPYIIKTDGVGNKIWEVNLGGPYSDSHAILCKSNDGNIIACAKYALDSLDYKVYPSKIQITKVDIRGEIIWNYLYGDLEVSTGPSNIRNDNTGGFIISGAAGDNHWSEPELMGLMLRIDSSGNELWYRKYGVLWDYDSRNYLYDVIPTSNNGFLGVGGCLPMGDDTGNQDAWVIKVDSMGCTSPWDCWVGEEELEIGDNSNTIHIYPNPATNKFTVQSEKFEVGGCQLQVFDLFGRKVEEVEIPEGKSEIKVFTQGWQKGLYVVRVVDKTGLVGSGKILIK